MLVQLDCGPRPALGSDIAVIRRGQPFLVISSGPFFAVSGAVFMNIVSRAGLLTLLLVGLTPAQAADNLGLERLAICQDSWLDWKASDPAQLKKFIDGFQADFSHKGNDAFFVPKSTQTVAGLPVAQVFPESIGMAVGFSIVVNADFNKTKTSLEKKIGKAINKCEPPSDNMRSCGLEIGEKKTIALMAEDNPKSTTTLVGCYYFYEK
jgi:hypothetical protein